MSVFVIASLKLIGLERIRVQSAFYCHVSLLPTPTYTYTLAEQKLICQDFSVEARLLVDQKRSIVPSPLLPPRLATRNHPRTTATVRPACEFHVFVK